MGLVAGVIFVLDLLIPPDVTVGVLYVAVIFMSLRYRNLQLPLWVALGCSSLTIIAFFLSPIDGELWKALMNQGLALLVIWTTTIMGRQHLQQSATIYLRDRSIEDFMNSIPSACFSFDREGTILSWNAAAEQVYGYSKAEAVGASSYELIVTPEAQEGTQHVIDSVFQGETFANMLRQDRNKKRERGWRMVDFFPVRDAEDHIAYGFQLNVDITTQKASEEQLRTQHARLKAILNSSSDAIYAKDQEGKYLFANQATANIMGQPPEAIIGKDDDALYGSDTAKALKLSDDMVLHHTETLNIEETIPIAGCQQIFSSSKSPLQDAAGANIGVVSVSREITNWKQAQKDLLLTDLLFMTSPDHISIVGRDYRYRRINATYLTVHQKSSQEILSMSVSDLLGKEVFHQTVKPMIDQCFQGKEIHYEAWFTFANDHRRYMAVSHFPLTHEGLEVEEIVVVGKDLTERKHMEDALNASERQLRTILNAMTHFVGVGTVDGVMVDCNQAPLTMAGLTRKDVIGKPFIDTYWLNYSSAIQEQIHRIIQRVGQGEIVREDIQVRMGENLFITVDACYVPVRNSEGQVVQIVHSSIDVTARRAAEQALAENQKKLKALMDHSPNLIFMKDLEGRYLQINKRFEQVFHVSKSHVIGATDQEIFSTEQAAQFQGHDQLVLQARASIEVEETATHDDGIHTSLVHKFPLQDQSGAVYAIGGIATDITDRKRIENELRASESRYRSLIETAGSIIIGLTPDGWIVEWNREAERLFGKTREEVLDQNFFELFLREADRSHLMAAIQNVLEGKATRDFQNIVMRSDGNLRKISWNVDRLLNENHQPYGVIGIGRDITEWEHAQTQLQKWATIYQHTQWGVAVGDANSQSLDMVNEAYARMHGYTVEELQGQPISQVFAPEFLSQLPAMIQFIHERGFHSFESLHIRRDGTIFPALFTVSTIKDIAGMALYRVANVIDISNLKHVQLALLESQQVYHDLVQTIEGVVWECEFPSYQITFVSHYGEHILGHPIQQWYNDPLFLINIIHPDDRQRISALCHEATLRKDNHVMEYRVLHANGDVLWVRAQVTVVVKNDQPIKLRGVMLDITDLKQAEQSLSDSQKLALGTMNAIGAQICVLNETGTILLVNDRWKNFALSNGGSLDHVGIGKNYFSSCKDVEDIEKGIREVLKGDKKEFSFEYPCHSPTTNRWFICRVNRFSEQEPARAVVAHLDITDQKQAEQRLRENEVFTNSILENLPNMVFVKNAENLQFVRINKAGESLLGYERQDLFGKNDFDFFPKDEADFFYKNDQMVLSNGKLLDIPEEFIHTKDRGVRTLHTKKIPICDMDGTPIYLLGISEDITEHKRVEEELRKTESTLKSFFDSAPMMMGVVEVTLDDVRHLSDNRATANFFGQPEGGTTGKWCSQLGMPQNVRQIWINHYQLSLTNHQPISFEYAHPFSQETRWVAATVAPVFFKNSSLPRCAYIAQDITERKTMENHARSHAEELEKEVERRTTRIQELEQRRMQVEKLAALAQIAAGVAHEINNPLASISQSLVLLKRAIPKEHPHFHYMAKTEDCIERIAQITKHLYQLYRPNSPTPLPIDLRICIQTAKEIMRKRTIKQEIEIEVPALPEPIITHLSQGELIQVLCNLIHNAMDASPSGSSIEVSLTTEPGTVSIFVADQGTGISPKDAPHIFEPFFTTKQNQEDGGMGLGLAISHSLVESMGGILDFTTKIGHGTTFRISLPLTTT